MKRNLLVAGMLLIAVLVMAACGGAAVPTVVPPTNTPTVQPTTAPNIANPASVYCKQTGGKLELKQDAKGGTVGICIFPDKSECEEWAYYRGECKPGDKLGTK